MFGWFKKPNPLNRFRRGDFEDILRKIGEKLDGRRFVVGSSNDHTVLSVTNKEYGQDKDVHYTLTLIMSPRILASDGCDMTLELDLFYHNPESDYSKTKKISKSISRVGVDRFALSVERLALIVNTMLTNIDHCKASEGDVEYNVNELELELRNSLYSFSIA